MRMLQTRIEGQVSCSHQWQFHSFICTLNHTVIIAQDSSNKKIVSYIRYLKDEFFLVISSFESNVTQIDITLKDETPNIEELAHMRDNNEMSSDSNITGLWQYFDAKDGREVWIIVLCY